MSQLIKTHSDSQKDTCIARVSKNMGQQSIELNEDINPSLS